MSLVSCLLVYLGSDHRGYELKEKIKKFLDEFGYDHEDLGAFEYNKDDDYPDFAKLVGEKVAANSDGHGILICGSGIGIAIAANKIKGVRAGTASNPQQVAASVHDEDLNVLAIASDYIKEDDAKELVRIFLETKFHGEERHVRRVNKIKELEK